MADRFSNRPSFADNFDRGGPRPGADAPSDGDPLAELARLIGQTDPQSNFARGRQANPPQAPRSLATDFSVGPPSWMQTAQAQQTRSQPAPSYVEPEPQPYETQQYEAEQEPHLTPMPAFLQAQHPQHPEQAPADRYDRVLYGHDDPQQDQEYDEQQGYADEDYADEQFDGPPAFLENEDRRRRPGGLLTVAVVLGLAVVGTAGAYAYRSYSATPRSGTPPVIKADNAPSKVVPPTQSSDSAGKLIYDRIGNSSAPERVVSREEQPVDVNANAPRSVFPPVVQGGGAQQASTAPDDGGTDSPRKVRTVPISRRPGERRAARGAARASGARCRAHCPGAGCRARPAGRQRADVVDAECARSPEQRALGICRGASGSRRANQRDPDHGRFSCADRLAKERVRGASFVPHSAGQVREPDRFYVADHQARRSRRQRRVLPGDGGTVPDLG